jgi:hypothetical protein
MLRWRALSGSTTACAVDAQGAVGDNRTDDTAAIQLTVDKCRAAFPNGATVLLSEKKTYRVRRSIALASNLTLAFGPNATLFSALKPSDPIFQHPRCPTLYWPHGPTAVLCGTNLTNVALLGADETSSVLDGGGWPWYAAGEANSSMQGAGPRLFEVAWSRNLTLSRLAFVNSPAWNIHPTFSTGVMAENLRILAPRFTPNTDGFDPDSCADVTLRDSHIDVGDDGISIKSGNSTQPGSSHVQMPSRNIHVHRVTVLSRNLCVGSATYGGVYDLVVEDCTIGDDAGSAPWAIKYKSHQSYPGAMRNHTCMYMPHDLRTRLPTCLPMTFALFPQGAGCASDRSSQIRTSSRTAATSCPSSCATIPSSRTAPATRGTAPASRASPSRTSASRPPRAPVTSPASAATCCGASPFATSPLRRRRAPGGAAATLTSPASRRTACSRDSSAARGPRAAPPTVP